VSATAATAFESLYLEEVSATRGSYTTELRSQTSCFILAQPSLTNAGLTMLLAYVTLHALDMRQFGFATFVSILIGL
jgi:hypothetical protein